MSVVREDLSEEVNGMANEGKFRVVELGGVGVYSEEKWSTNIC